MEKGGGTSQTCSLVGLYWAGIVSNRVSSRIIELSTLLLAEEVEEELGGRLGGRFIGGRLVVTHSKQTRTRVVEVEGKTVETERRDGLEY